jgi:hypothetical protein
MIARSGAAAAIFACQDRRASLPYPNLFLAEEHMRIIARHAIGCMALLVAASAGAWADTVELDNGRRIEGLVVSETPIEVVVKLDSGGTLRFARARVKAITRSDWQTYIEKGDAARDGAEALEYYKKAQALNPSAPGLDEKIKNAKQRIADAVSNQLLLQQRDARRIEEAKVVAEYERFMDAVKPDEARSFLVRAIAGKPWLAKPRVYLADFYYKDKTAEGRAKYIDVLAGLVQNDPDAHYAEHAMRIVQTAESLLTDPQWSGKMSIEQKDQVITQAAPYVGPTGEQASVDLYKQTVGAMQSPASATLAKIEFLKNVCIKRPAGEPVVGEYESPFQSYAKQLTAPEAQAAFKARLEEWTKHAAQWTASSTNAARGAALGEVILVFDPASAAGRKAAIVARLQDAEKYRQRNQYEQALKAVEEAQAMAPLPEVANEKARVHVGLAQFRLQSNDLRGAVQSLLQADNARPSDKAVASSVDQAKRDLAKQIQGLSEAAERQKNPDLVTAINYANLANQLGGARSGSGAGLGSLLVSLAGGGPASGGSRMETLKSNLALDLINRSNDAIEKNRAYDKVKGYRDIAKAYEVYDRRVTIPGTKTSMTLEGLIQQRVEADKKQALVLSNQNKDYEVFQILSSLEPVYTDDKIKEMLERHKKVAVTDGGLAQHKEFFCFRSWQGPGARLDILPPGSQRVQFTGGALRSLNDAVTVDSINVTHEGANRYRVTVRGTNTTDDIVVSVGGFRNITLISYKSQPASAIDQVQPIMFNIPMVDVTSTAPPPAPQQGSSAPKPADS